MLSDQVGTASTAGPVYILGEGGAGGGVWERKGGRVSKDTSLTVKTQFASLSQ